MVSVLVMWCVEGENEGRACDYLYAWPLSQYGWYTTHTTHTRTCTCSAVDAIDTGRLFLNHLNLLGIETIQVSMEWGPPHRCIIIAGYINPVHVHFLYKICTAREIP